VTGGIHSWQGVRGEVQRRIAERIWTPGDLIPHEADLAREFGCARATVNRALRDLAEAGILDRRRKAGTRVAINPVRKARLDIPVIRDEIEARGQTYSHAVLTRTLRAAPAEVGARMKVTAGAELLHLQTLHTADGAAYVFEDRWINPRAVPEAVTADFSAFNANEWLVRHVPFEGGDFTFLAITSTPREAGVLGCGTGEGLFVVDRTTWTADHIITSVRLVYPPGYRMHTEI